MLSLHPLTRSLNSLILALLPMLTTSLCHSNRQEVVYVDTLAEAAHNAVTREKREQVHEPYCVNPRFRGLGNMHVTFVLRKVTWRSNPLLLP